jgi:glutamine amidotransferase
VSSDPAVIASAERLILPGVGAFGDGMERLKSLGLVEALRQAVFEKRVPFLGICLGMQLLAEESDEYGTHEGLGWMKGVVRRLDESSGLKVPHIGWNNLDIKREHPLLKGIPNGADVYFVHSFAFQPADPADIVGVTEYGGEVTAAVGRDNVFATQFHPEKSQEIGLKLLENFLKWNP